MADINKTQKIYNKVLNFFKDRDYEFDTDASNYMVRLMLHDKNQPKMVVFIVDKYTEGLLCSSLLFDSLNKKQLLKLIYAMNLINNKSNFGYFSCDEDNDAAVYIKLQFVGDEEIDDDYINNLFGSIMAQSIMFMEQLQLLNEDKVSLEKVVKYIKEKIEE